ncbi:MAG: nucleotide exchange factor GrpE [Saprospiraceae bacterium]
MAKKLNKSFWSRFLNNKEEESMENPNQEHIETPEEVVEKATDTPETQNEEQMNTADEVADEKTEATTGKKKKRGSRGGSGAKKAKQLEEEIENLEKEIVTVEEERNELKDKYLRLFAEFDNYKRRTAKERVDLLKTASGDVLREILPVLDDFDRAKMASGDEGLGEGVQLIYDKLFSTMARKGLTPMESTGEVFDAEFHEAITEIPAPTEEMKGKVIDTIEKGYTLGDKIIRYAKVVVGK